MRYALCFALLAACASSRAPIDAGHEIADAPTPIDAGASPPTCPDGLIADGAWCFGWRSIERPQRCLNGRRFELVRIPMVHGDDADGFLAVQCEDEPLQIYDPYLDRWERSTTVVGSPIVPPEAPPSPQYPSVLAVGALPDGMRIGVAGSLHGAPPFETLIAEPGATEWHRSIDADWLNVWQAASIGLDEMLFVGEDAMVLTRARR